MSVKAKLPPLELGAAPQALEAIRQFQRCREISWRREELAAQYPEGSSMWAVRMDMARQYQARAERWLQLLESWLEEEAECLRNS